MEARVVDALLVGGGVASARCARGLRRSGFAGSIVVVGEESIPPYNRPPLSKELLRDDLPDDLVLAEQPTWYERRGVDLLMDAPALSLRPDERIVELADGTILRYGFCLLATGAEPIRPRMPGAEHALLLRTLTDARAVRARAGAGRRGVVVGGGFIGVEVAASLASVGMAVTVLERGPALWGGALGRTVSDWARERLAAAGVEVRIGSECTGLDADAVLVQGERLPADLVVAGVGVSPRTRLAEEAGLAVDDGIVVDESQRTSDAAVLAAGDVARVDGTARVEHWHAARESGERAALAMTGQPMPERRAPWVYSEFAAANLDVVGAAGAGDEEAVLAPGLVGWVRAGRLSQVAVLDHARPVEDMRALVERGAAPAEVG